MSKQIFLDYEEIADNKNDQRSTKLKLSFFKTYFPAGCYRDKSLLHCSGTLPYIFIIICSVPLLSLTSFGSFCDEVS